MGMFANITDGLVNALTGAGTARDPRMASGYRPTIMSQAEIDAAVRGSGMMRKVINIPALDMVREWRTWTGMDADQMAAMYEEEQRLALRQKVRVRRRYCGVWAAGL